MNDLFILLLLYVFPVCLFVMWFLGSAIMVMLSLSPRRPLVSDPHDVPTEKVVRVCPHR